MTSQWIKRNGKAAVTIIGLAALLLCTISVGAAPFDEQRGRFANDRFASLWARTDSQSVRGNRTLYWGPAPWFGYGEFYRQGGNGLREVQYFDKARMELNDPAEVGGPQQGVTNGLLVKELVSGRLQRGDDPLDYDQRLPAEVPVAGNPAADNQNAPTYRSFAGVATLENGYRSPNRIGDRIAATLDKDGAIGSRHELATAETTIVQYNDVTGHNISAVFWDFITQRGPVQDSMRVRDELVSDWLLTVGQPLSDGYWTRARIGAEERDVLVQLFERRVLTYVPSNPAGYQVEMGNVGQHYFQWRYPQLGHPWAASAAESPLVYASQVQGVNSKQPHWQIFSWKPGDGSIQLTEGAAESVPYSAQPSWNPAQTQVLGESRRGDGTTRQIYGFGSPLGEAQARRLIYSDGAAPPPGSPHPGHLPNGSANEYNPSFSPDGTKIAFISDRSGAPELFLVGSSGNSPLQLTDSGCTSESPTWSPDGRTLFWANNCDGDFELYRGDLSYGNEDSYSVDAALVNVSKLTNNSSDDRQGRVSPDGRRVAFTAYRDGSGDIYVMNSDGSGQSLLLGGPSADESPTWSPDGSQLAFASDRSGTYQIYSAASDGSGLRQLTDGTASRWPVWGR